MQATCLGNPPHPMDPTEVLCRQCGALRAGFALGSYQVQSLLGMRPGCQAYAAKDQTGRTVVLKLFSSHRVPLHSWSVAENIAWQIRKWQHPAIHPILNSTQWTPDRSASIFYYVSIHDYVPGNLLHLLAFYARQQKQQFVNQQMLVSMLFPLLHQIGQALSFAHEQGVWHGAPMPTNILTDGKGQGKLADFGFARLIPPTSPYLPPEWGQGGPRSAEEAILSDQYIFALLCAQVLVDFCKLHDPMLRMMLQKGFHRQPEQRYPTMQHFLQELDGQLRRGTPSQSGVSFSQMSPSMSQIWQWSPSRSLSLDTPSMERKAPQAASPTHRELMIEGNKLYRQGRFEEAIKRYQQALKLDPRNATLWTSIGDASFALELYAEAIHAYDQALMYAPRDRDIWMNKGAALEAMGRKSDANKCYQQAQLLEENE